MTLTLDVQGQWLKELYSRNGMADWYRRDGMWVDLLLDPLYDFIFDLPRDLEHRFSRSKFFYLNSYCESTVDHMHNWIAKWRILTVLMINMSWSLWLEVYYASTSAPTWCPPITSYCWKGHRQYVEDMQRVFVRWQSEDGWITACRVVCVGCFLTWVFWDSF